MKVCAAQLKLKPGDIELNLREHIMLINKAIANGIDLIFFPELSLTGYEPLLANSLACDKSDSRLDILQALSDDNNIIICVGMPIKQAKENLIGFVIFQPQQERTVYAKQLLHEDELPYFKKGTEQVFINYKNEIIAPAICFESLQENHAMEANKQGTSIYLASVAKHELGVERGHKHYSSISNRYGFITLMANCHGTCDNFISFGSSAVWNDSGECLARLSDSENGLVGIDTSSGEPILVK